MYNPEKLVEPLIAFQMEFPSDLGFVMVSGGGKALEHLGYKLYKWPGHGLPDTQGYQAVEGEYVTVDEYPKLIADPSDFFMRTYLPRTFGELEALRMLPLLPIIAPAAAYNTGDSDGTIGSHAICHARSSGGPKKAHGGCRLHNAGHDEYWSPSRASSGQWLPRNFWWVF
jgi:hypothetical protein